jgi:hypothetical protein
VQPLKSCQTKKTELLLFGNVEQQLHMLAQRPLLDCQCSFGKPLINGVGENDITRSQFFRHCITERVGNFDAKHHKHSKATKYIADGVHPGESR